MRTFQIVGRIPDEENIALVIKAKNLDSALKKFEKLLYDNTDEEKDNMVLNYGVSIYFDGVFEGEVSYDPDQYFIPTSKTWQLNGGDLYERMFKEDEK